MPGSWARCGLVSMVRQRSTGKEKGPRTGLVWRWRGSVPAQRTAGLVLGHAGLEEVALLLQVDHLAHPREGVFLVREQRIEADLDGAAIRDEAQVALEHRGVQAQHAARHGVFGVAVLELDG